MRDNFNLGQVFRINDWWQSKAALLMGFSYLYAVWFLIPFRQMISLSLLSAITISGFASVGYLSNDFFDRKKDTLAGKKNFLVGKSIFTTFIFFTIAILLLACPWFYLPFNKIAGLLITIELLLFILYSVKPFRLKERGWAGIITDALYAHTVPVLLALYTFGLASSNPLFFLPTTILVLWQTVSGIRNILLHQHEDVYNDEKSGLKNYVARIPDRKKNVYLKTLIISEILLSVSFFAYLALENWLFIYCIVLVFFFCLMTFIAFYNSGFSVLMQTRWKYFPNQVFEKWIPLVILSILSTSDLHFLWFISLHVLAFNFSFLKQLDHYFVPVLIQLFNFILYQIVIRFFIFIRTLFSFLLNYSIYFFLLLFKIDLKQEKTTAFEYFKEKFKRK